MFGLSFSLLTVLSQVYRRCLGYYPSLLTVAKSGLWTPTKESAGVYFGHKVAEISSQNTQTHRGFFSGGAGGGSGRGGGGVWRPPPPPPPKALANFHLKTFNEKI